MDMRKAALRQRLFVVAVNRGLMNEEVRRGLERFDKSTFVKLLRTQIQQLRLESCSGATQVPEGRNSRAIATLSEALEHIDQILSEPD